VHEPRRLRDDPGRPAHLADPAWSPEAFGFVEFQASRDAVLMAHDVRAGARRRQVASTSSGDRLPLLLDGGMQLTPSVSPIPD
jgi:hypothetical protein